MDKDSRSSSRDRMLRYLLSNLTRSSADDGDARRDERMDLRTARELIGAIASWAGKGKDEIVQVLCREIGQATAAVLREPLTQVLENRKLQITFEFVPKNQTAPTEQPKTRSTSPARSAGRKKKR